MGSGSSFANMALVTVVTMKSLSQAMRALDRGGVLIREKSLVYEPECDHRGPTAFSA